MTQNYAAEVQEEYIIGLHDTPFTMPQYL